jgi:hypothetical protein
MKIKLRRRREDASPAPQAADNTCTGIKPSGERCKLKLPPGSGDRCIFHPRPPRPPAAAA